MLVLLFNCVDYDGKIQLLELAQVSQEFSEEFNSGRVPLGLVLSGVHPLEF